ncbi:MAG: HAD family hydrolase [Clostridiales bacterium]|jgi:Cof subfamily protein (haloacid dehalogenase superfamily)|nr:HAD family hydrolase [Clostridiales bacterium]
MKYKMIVSDFDNTLYGHTVSVTSKKAILEYIKKGGIFAISTGRPYTSLKMTMSQFGLQNLDIFVMCYQGATTQRQLTGELIFEKKLANKIALDWLKSVYRNYKNDNICISMYAGEKMLVEKNAKQNLIKLTDENFQEVDSLVEYLQSSKMDLYKFCVIGDEHTLLSLQSQVEREFANMQFCISHPNLLEVTSSHAGKGNMVSTLAQSLNIDLSSVICIGDNQNDISMLQCAGLGVAVGNAREDVKQCATLIAPDCDDDGVAYIINKAILGQL